MAIGRHFMSLLGVSLMTSLMAGCVAEKCGLSGCPGDHQITAQIQERFAQHTELGVRINVQTLDRVVYLTGFVSAGEFRGVADQVAQSTPGVKRVVDNISVTK